MEMMNLPDGIILHGDAVMPEGTGPALDGGVNVPVPGRPHAVDPSTAHAIAGRGVKRGSFLKIARHRRRADDYGNTSRLGIAGRRPFRRNLRAFKCSGTAAGHFRSCAAATRS